MVPAGTLSAYEAHSEQILRDHAYGAPRGDFPVLAVPGHLSGKECSEATGPAGRIHVPAYHVDRFLVLGEDIMRYLFLSLMMVVALPSTGLTGYRENFEQEFLTKTWSGEQVEEHLCIACHSSDKMKA